MAADRSPAFRALLEVQHRVVTRAQCAAYGVTDGVLRQRVASGTWRGLTPGVYLTVDQEPTPRQRVQAAVLAAGQGAAAGRRTALWLWQDEAREAAEAEGRTPLTRTPPLPARLDVEVLEPVHRVARPGAVLHRVPTLGDSRVHPLRLPRRTRVEVAVVDSIHDGREPGPGLQLVDDVLGARLTTPQRLRAAAEARPRLRHRALLAAALGEHEAGAMSRLEREHRGVLRRHGLAAGRRQVRLRPGHWADVVMELPRGPLVTELDGLLGHAEGRGRHRDRRRDNAVVVQLAGTALRYGWVDVVGDGCGVAAETAVVLSRLGWRGSPRACDRPECALRLATAS